MVRKWYLKVHVWNITRIHWYLDMLILEANSKYIRAWESCLLRKYQCLSIKKKFSVLLELCHNISLLHLGAARQVLGWQQIQLGLPGLLTIMSQWASQTLFCLPPLAFLLVWFYVLFGCLNTGLLCILNWLLCLGQTSPEITKYKYFGISENLLKFPSKILIPWGTAIWNGFG